MDIDLSFITDNYFAASVEAYIKQLFKINKELKGILLFGSLAKGEAVFSEKKASDVDLFVIFSDNELPQNHIDRINEKIELMDSKGLGFDTLWVTETEFKNYVKIKADIILSALYKGKILYDPIGLIKEQKQKLFEELKNKGVIKRKNYWIWPIKHLGDEIKW